MGELPGVIPEVMEATDPAVAVLGRIRVPTGNTFMGEAVSPTFSLTVVFGAAGTVIAGTVVVIEAVEVTLIA